MDGADAAGRAGGAIVSGGLGLLIGLVAHCTLSLSFMDPIACADRGQTVGQPGTWHRPDETLIQLIQMTFD
jgi:hypothetical protein